MINLNFFPNHSAVRWLFLALATLVLVSRAPAQAVAASSTASPQRWLFIFDTSAAMKKRLPATEAELKTIFFSNISGQLHSGDTVGVWTFNDKLHAGEFPLVIWNPQMAAEVSSNLVGFIDQQHYSGKTTFATFQTVLGRVIDDSDRLTVIVFCDGDDTLKLTPDDDSINQTFHQLQATQKNLHQPFILVVRTQSEQFAGSTMNFPPGKLDLPVFPPPIADTEPAAPTPVAPATHAAAPVIAPVPKPEVLAPPLIIVGTHVGTNLEDLQKLAVPAPASPVVTNPPPIAAPVASAQPENIKTAPVAAPVSPTLAAAPATNLTPTQNVAAPAPVIVAPTSVVTTNAVIAATDSNGDGSTRLLIFIGAGLLLMAILLLLFLALHKPRPPRESLITSSMHNDPRPPAPK